MPSARLRLCCLTVCVLAVSRLQAQQEPPAPSQSPRVLAATPPLLSGFNVGVTVAGVHDSYVGWYNVATPALSYAFSPRYSADLSMSIYPYRLAPNAAGQFLFAGGDLGDMLVEAHATFTPGSFRDTATASMTLPTGNRTDGLGTGRVTFNFDNHLERYVGRTGFLLDVGGGDSSGLVNRLVTEDDDALGPLAQFQAGLVTWLAPDIALQSVAYEQLPIGDQKTYSTIPRPPGPPLIVVNGRKVNEDNGFTTSLFVPLTEHVTLTSSYNRSLRLHLDTVSVGLTFVWKGSAVRRRESLIDRAIREAETGSPAVKPPR